MTDPAPELAPARRPRRGRLLVIAFLLVLVAAGAWTAYRALQARDHLEQARAQLLVAKAALLDRRIPEAEAAVAAAGTETERGRVFADDPVVRVLARVPLAGRSVRVLRGIALGADDIARQVLPTALVGVRDLDPGVLRRPDGSIDLGILATARPGIDQASQRMAAVAADVDALPTSLVPGQVRSPQDAFTGEVDDLADTLRAAADALEIAPVMLGSDRPRRWFVLVQQTSESRGTGGLPGGFAVLEADKGRLSVSRRGSNADLPSGTIAPKGLPEDYVGRYGNDGAFDIWQNINLSPDLPVVSRYLKQRWQTQSGQVVDGVIALDAAALADLLQGSGPVAVGPGQTIPPEGIEAYLALGQYADVAGTGNQVGRKEQLTVVADAVIARLTGGGGDTTALLRGLSKAVRTNHINVGTDDEVLAEPLRRTGTDGALPHDDAPFVLPVVYNAAGSKLEYFLDRKVRYETLACAKGLRRTRVTVTLETHPPSLAELPPYVTIRIGSDGKITQSLVDRLNLAVYATKGARLASSSLDGKAVMEAAEGQPLTEGSEAGLPVWSTFVDLQPNTPRTLVLELVEPVRDARARVLEQPLTRSQQSTVDVHAC